ncbi:MULTISPECIES: hypothetical protein [unclassified Streptomyces]|uniref:hypothetical protein n=1 Tax=unclassified Streptomyces TaxID=2593676 RepID=UPI0016605F94|nr:MULTISPECIES: hypothetical protein [unclassified Streptomyces]MBD0708424.1 hypothetical protein [Streptomyces sp. CBMA291]MBD0717862.1 hypothetical protein [Streptomyces sp. CBMA370]
MTDWTKLSHAYGSAEDIPGLLERIASGREPGLWTDLWSALCHQGSVYPASFAALPRLADLTESEDRAQAVNALNLAGAIMAGAEQPGTAEDVRARHAATVARLLASVNRHLRTATGPTEYIELLESMLGFEGVPGWSENLSWGIVNEEYEISCPGCGTDLYIVLGEAGFFCTSTEYALPDDTADATGTADPAGTRPLRPAVPTDPHGIGGRLHALATADGRHEIAHVLTHVFGDATCPDCSADFTVADRVGAD